MSRLIYIMVFAMKRTSVGLQHEICSGIDITTKAVRRRRMGADVEEDDGTCGGGVPICLKKVKNILYDISNFTTPITTILHLVF